MTTLTPSQRLEAYRWAKENFETHGTGPFLCNVLFFCVNDNVRYETSYADIKKYLNENFPELIKQKPEYKTFDGYGGWFKRSDSESRHQVLDKCISEVQKLIEKETV